MIKFYKPIAMTVLVLFSANTYATHSGILPKHIIIITNLEDVLIRKDWFSIVTGTARGYFKSDNKLQLAKLLLSYSFLHDCYLAARKELYDADGKYLLHKSDYLAYFARTYPALKKHEAELFDITHEYALDENMIAYYLWLKISKNYALYVATNKNRASYRLIKKKLDDALHKRFGIGWNDLFDGAFYVDKIDPATGIQFAYSAKPDADYFLGLWNYLLTKRSYTKDSVHLMYIDDAEPNILAAQATHHEYGIPIDGVYFKQCEQIKHAITLLAESLEKNSHGGLD